MPHPGLQLQRPRDADQLLPLQQQDCKPPARPVCMEQEGLACASSDASADASPGAGDRRLPLTMHTSLIVEQPDPAVLRGGTRRTLLRALRQLRAPAGPELLEGSEHLLGPVYSRFLFHCKQAGPAVMHAWHLVS